MTSYTSVEFALNKRHLPRSQVEAIPGADDDSASDDGSSVNPASLRANFMSPGTEFPILDPSYLDRYGSYRDQSPYFSPVFSHLPTIDPDTLRLPTEKAQHLRRKLMRFSNVLIIQGGYIGKAFVYEKLRNLGVNVYIMDGPDSIWRKIAEEGGIQQFIELDFTENDTIFERAMEAILESDLDVKFDAVTTYYEDAVALAARIATALGVPTNSVEACDNARNKRRTRQLMKEAGLPVPRFYAVHKETDIPPACEYVGFPAILKPVYGASSMGVTRVENVDDAIAAYKKLFRTFNINEDTIWAQGTEMVIEEYYDGDEFDIDLLLSDGSVVYAKVSDNWACWEPWFQEAGTNCPSTYPEEKQAELVKLSIDSTLAMGFKYGCFHVECKYTSRGPRLIEINARMGGVSVRDANFIAWGIDLVEEHCMSALKIPIRPIIPEKPLQYMAECAINAPYSGILESDTWLDFVKENPLVRKVSYFMHKGDKVIGPEDGMPDWLGEIVVVSDNSQQEALDLLKSIMEETLRVPIKPKREGAERRFFFPSHRHPFSQHETQNVPK